MKVRASQTCCGCFTLWVGVTAISFFTILSGIVLISLCSSEESIKVAGNIVHPTVQVALASWGFLGIIAAVNAGVGVVYRVEAPIKVFFYYQVISFLAGFLVPLAFLVSGDLCDSVVDHEVQRMGSAFVCGFADTVYFAWLLIVGIVHAYAVYIVWSAAEEIARDPYPELERYRVSLTGVEHAEPPGVFPLNSKRAIPSVDVGQPEVTKVNHTPTMGFFTQTPRQVSTQYSPPPYAPGGGIIYGATLGQVCRPPTYEPAAISFRASSPTPSRPSWTDGFRAGYFDASRGAVPAKVIGSSFNNFAPGGTTTYGSTVSRANRQPAYEPMATPLRGSSPTRGASLS